MFNKSSLQPFFFKNFKFKKDCYNNYFYKTTGIIILNGKIYNLF